MLNHDKQVKEFYSLVLGRVMNAIREDNLIMQAGVQSSAIEALEEVSLLLTSEVEKEPTSSSRICSKREFEHSG